MIETPSVVQTEHSDSPVENPVLRTGLYTGALLIIVMLGALVAANRIPALERYAFERNAACYTLFVLLMLVPVVRFLNRPLQMFGAAAIAWVMLVCAYDLAGYYFKDLYAVLRTPFQVLVEGAIVYALFAVGSWVCGMLLLARRLPIAPGRIKAAREAARHIR